MAKPSIMCIEDQPLKSAHDARVLLNNGKHVVQALKSILANGGVDTILAEEWCVEDLADTLTKGLFVDFVEYPEDDRDAQVAMQVLSHEQEQNKFRLESQSRSWRTHYRDLFLRGNIHAVQLPIM